MAVLFTVLKYGIVAPHAEKNKAKQTNRSFPVSESGVFRLLLGSTLSRAHHRTTTTSGSEGNTVLKK